MGKNNLIRTSSSFVETKNILSLSQINKNTIVIDIRSKQAYLATHIINSINLTTKDEIIKFISQNPFKEYILCCMSSHKAAKLANEINMPNVKYYNGNMLEAKDSGVEFISSDDSFKKLINQTKTEILNKYLSYKRAFIIAFSGGKDSTCVLQLFYEMIINLPKDKLNPTYAILSDTLVEAPNVENYLKEIVQAINSDAKKRKIPFEILLAKPSPKDEFWVNLVGKGYPSPTRTFRWCTERLKIKPMKSIVKTITDKHGSAILALGVRKSESLNRKHSIEKRTLSEDGFSKHDDYENVLIFSPIKEWSTDDVWSYLTAHNPPSWGLSHNRLFELYTQASGDECQFIIDKNQSSCGGSRFGCWVCTLVNEDKSMQGFIKSGEKSFEPLNRFRNFIKDARENKELRSDFKKDGRCLPGPFTSEARKQIFRLLMQCEEEFKNNGGDALISDEQILLIAKEWNKDFDSENSCIKIAKEYGRMENIEIVEQYLPDESLIENMEYANTTKSIIKEAISLKNSGAKDSDIYSIIEKHLNNQTMKIKDKE